MAGGGAATGNSGDSRAQRNPVTAAPFGDFKPMQPQVQPAVFDAQPATPPMAPVDSVMPAGHQELMEARQLADQRRAQEAMGNALGAMPYGQPSRIEMPYGISKPMHGMAVPPHTHGENGEIQMGGVRGHTEGRPYLGPDQQFTNLGSAVTAFYK